MAATPEKTRLILFNNGEGVVPEDWNDLQKLLTFRAWDAIGQYSKGALSQGNPLSAFTFGSRFSTPGAWGALAGGPTFVFGPDFAFTGKTTNTLTIEPGFIGRNGKTTRVANVPSMEWVYVDGNNGGKPIFVVAANAGGGDRYDALSIAFVQTDEDTESRDFKDGTTGALSTTTPEKSRNIVATVTLTTGTEGGAIAVIPAGEHLLCYVKVLSGAAVIDDIFDYTIPINNIQVEQTAPTITAIWDDMGGAGSGDWDRVGGGAVNAAVAAPRNLYLHPISHSNPHARILALEISYNLDVASTVKLFVGGFGAGGSIAGNPIVDITSLLTNDGTAQKTVIEFVNPNLLLVDAPVEQRAPLWCNGLRHKTDQVNPATTATNPNKGIFLEIDSAAATDSIVGVSWLIAK